MLAEPANKLEVLQFWKLFQLLWILGAAGQRLEPQVSEVVGLWGAKTVGVNFCLQPEYGILKAEAEMIPLP